jgi:hypothetical protein
MGFFSTLFGGSESETEADKILQSGFGGLPGFDAKTGTETLQGIATDRLGQNLDPFDIPDSTPGFDFNSFLSNSAFGNPLQSELSSPNFGPQNPNEQALINSLISQVQGNSAVRGLDPSFGSIAQTIAPELINMRQKRIDNLQGAFGGELGASQTGRGQDIGERGADIAAGLTGRGQDIDFQSDKTAQAANIFTSLLGLDKQDTVVGGGRGSSTSSKGIGEAATAVAAIIASDRRLKENILKIGRLANGLFVYSYNYIWDNEPQIGVMADEVKKLIPEAVITLHSGYDAVNYGMVVSP